MGLKCLSPFFVLHFESFLRLKDYLSAVTGVTSSLSADLLNFPNMFVFLYVIYMAKKHHNIHDQFDRDCLPIYCSRCNKQLKYKERSKPNRNFHAMLQIKVWLPSGQYVYQSIQYLCDSCNNEFSVWINQQTTVEKFLSGDKK